MMTYPNPMGANHVLKPQPLPIVVLIIVLCFEAGYDVQELQQALMSVMVVLVAVLGVQSARA